MKKIICSFLAVFLFHLANAQKSPINYGIKDSSGYSVAYKMLHNTFNETVAYTTEGYWQSDHIAYIFIGFKDNSYFKGAISLKRNKGTWTVPVIRYKKVNPGKALAIVKNLENHGLWKMNMDSLNINSEENPDGTITKSTVSDGINYRFELIKDVFFLPIETYEPEYFLSRFPQYSQRKQFLKMRDNFLNAFKSL
jgi:hypothetical protein